MMPPEIGLIAAAGIFNSLPSAGHDLYLGAVFQESIEILFIAVRRHHPALEVALLRYAFGWSDGGDQCATVIIFIERAQPSRHIETAFVEAEVDTGIGVVFMVQIG